MSITHEVTIWCDICGNWEQFRETAVKARKKLKEKGWMRVPVTRGYPAFQDLCLFCAQERKAKK